MKLQYREILRTAKKLNVKLASKITSDASSRLDTCIFGLAMKESAVPLSVNNRCRWEKTIDPIYCEKLRLIENGFESNNGYHTKNDTQSCFDSKKFSMALSQRNRYINIGKKLLKYSEQNG